MKSPVADEWAAFILGQQKETMTETNQAYSEEMATSPMDPAHAWLQDTYDRTAQNYRAQDEEHISGRDYEHVSKILERVCFSFDREICVLDLGCGTGRYFHCVKNARELVGLDISQQMLDAARNPVRGGEVNAREIRLVQGDLFSTKFSEGKFDFIYCLGVFGNGCGVSARACRKVWNWLRPGGAWFFDATDASLLPRPARMRKKLAASVYSALPAIAKTAWVKRAGWPPFFVNDVNGVRRQLLRAGFIVEWITS